MHIVFDRNKGLILTDRTIPATSIVRNNKTGDRPGWDVTRTDGSTVPNGIPYQPEPFPSGIWHIIRVSAQPKNSAFYPFFIATDATRELPGWSLDERGNYLAESSKAKFWDRGLGIHKAWYFKDGTWIPSRTTHGCINVLAEADISWLADKVKSALAKNETITLEAEP